MKKTVVIFLVFVFLTGCTTPANQTPAGTIRVVASFYPLYEIAKRVGGDMVQVTNLVPAGAEPHDYEPTPHDIVALHQADLVLYNGAGLEPWSDKIIPELERAGIETINESKNFTTMGVDPHFWLDPINYEAEVDAVVQKLETILPADKAAYEANAAEFKKEIKDLDALYRNGLQKCTYRSFVTNHAAFAYLATRYDLTMIPIAGLSPDAEPSAQELATVADTMKKLKLKYILVETLVSPKIAEVLAHEVGATTLVMSPLEGLTDEEIAQGKKYSSVMKENLKNLRTALECR